ncbi:sigma 54-interacting transcriptional regulator [Effusibacillus pohliae]|uniref:sigma 54-interacting transcriptional regulator n=1 Tax=Effusibacillus pohliae TaxID=232270 RepID=UPI000361A8D1|nr:sigma 54-interacting transcriptional regulator [Effusibacillus pohliae]
MGSDQLSTIIETAMPILDALHDGLVIIDANGFVRYVNEANERITGLKREEVMGRYVTDAVPYSRLLQTLTTGQAQTGVRTRVRDREVVSNIVPLTIGGQCAGALSVFRDVTEVRRLTEQLQVATETIRTMQVQSLEQAEIVVGQHPQSRHVWRLAKKAALIPSTVLLTGESGTGKEVLAHYIHGNSERREKPFLAVNCAAIPESLLESELFGYEEGAFTGARKGGRPGYFEMAECGQPQFLSSAGSGTEHFAPLYRPAGTGAANVGGQVRIK